jgi:hypothetical protein
MVARNYCYKVVPHKVYVVDYDRFHRDYMKDKRFVVVFSMKNGKLIKMDLRMLKIDSLKFL